ncbi:unnamed protein product [Bemisia tabaci]|uniref:NADH-ubiquinone oxidoreductase chain 3 n=1 Tax=Bemisia tabaci TaxID=7038 RepID=A0A9P0EZL7_BEMTA|nr:unnamed protein product [Bemisia tabaci]
MIDNIRENEDKTTPSSKVINKKSINAREKFSTFECGIDLITSLRLPFSLHFYFVSIIFLIFDVEVIFDSSICILF